MNHFIPDPLWLEDKYVRLAAASFPHFREKKTATLFEFQCPYCVGMPMDSSRQDNRAHAAFFKIGSPAKWFYKCQRPECVAFDKAKNVRGFLKDHRPEMYRELVEEALKEKGLMKGKTDWENEPEAVADIIAAGTAKMKQRFGGTPATTGTVPTVPIMPQTDPGNAEYFAWRYGDRVRYDRDRKEWLVWDKHYWKPDTLGTVVPLAVKAMRHRADTARTRLKHHNPNVADEDVKREFAHALKSENRIDKLLSHAATLPTLTVRSDVWDADEWLLGVKNGVVDLRTGQLRDGRKEDYITRQVAVDFNPHATAKTWERFVDDVMDGNPEMVRFIWQAIGYSLTGTIREQCWFLLHGTSEGSNGKSTLMEIIRNLLGVGEYAHQMNFEAIAYVKNQQRHTTEMKDLEGRRFVSVAEPYPGAVLNASRIKDVTGDEVSTARRMQQNNTTFRNTAKLWLPFNDTKRPRTTDDTKSFFRRVRPIAFNRTFPIDMTLPARLKAELPGILAWAVRGCLDWQQSSVLRQDALPLPVRQRIESWQHDEDPLSDFYDDVCVVGKGHKAQAKELWDAYMEYCERASQQNLDKHRFTKLLVQRFGKSVREGKGNFYRGVGIVADNLLDGYDFKSKLAAKKRQAGQEEIAV